MIIVEVSFKIDPSLTQKKLREKFLETAPIYKKTPGLIRKNYISDLNNNIAGGVYCFDNMLNAKNVLMMKELNGSQIDTPNLH